MQSKIKIRTMKDDLADTGNENLSETKQDQNKTNIAPVKTAGSDIARGAAPNKPGKLEGKEIDELKNLIKRISKDSDEKKSEEKHIEKHAEKEATTTDIASKKIISKLTQSKLL